MYKVVSLLPLVATDIEFYTMLTVSRRAAQVGSSLSSGIQAGTSLIEALVAMVVLSLGLLGLAGLQLNAMKTSQGAHLRAQAAEHAYDMIDRMRADRDNARSGKYKVLLTASAPNGDTLAAKEVASWLALVASTLPAGDASIAMPDTQTVTITIQWNDTRSGGGTTEQYVLQSQL